MLILIAVLLALILWALLSPESLKSSLGAALFIVGSVAFVFALKAIFYG